MRIDIVAHNYLKTTSPFLAAIYLNFQKLLVWKVVDRVPHKVSQAIELCHTSQLDKDTAKDRYWESNSMKGKMFHYKKRKKRKTNEVMGTWTTALQPFCHLSNSDNTLPRLLPVPSTNGYLKMLCQQYTINKSFTKLHEVSGLFMNTLNQTGNLKRAWIELLGKEHGSHPENPLVKINHIARTW